VLEFGQLSDGARFGIILLALWSIFWKGVALWFSARSNQVYWFVALLLLQTVGILEIVYMIFFRKRDDWRHGYGHR